MKKTTLTLLTTLLFAPLFVVQASDEQKPSVTHESSAAWFWDLFKKPQRLPLSVPLDITKKGNKAVVDFRAVYQRGYWITMKFKCNMADRAEYYRVRKITGSPDRNRFSADGKRIPAPPEIPGIPIVVRMKIFLIENQHSKLVYQKEVESMGCFSWCDDGISKLVCHPILDPGNYKVEVESLRNYPELVGQEIQLQVYWDKGIKLCGTRWVK